MLMVRNLACRRGGRVVFRETGLTVAPGGFVSVTGANGSGKSSLLRVLAGLIEPWSGSVLWQDADIAQDAAAHRARLHYIGHLDALKPGVTAGEMLDYWRALRGLGGGPHAEILAGFGLDKKADMPVRSLSAGQKRRLSLSRLLMDRAPLWLLDEPATALDAAGQELLRGHIARHRANGGIVIAATHDELAVPDMQKINMAGAGS